MQAYRLTAPRLEGLQINEEPIPLPEPNEVVVKMHAASLNFKDTFYLGGEKGVQLPSPTIPLSDGAGEVVALGSHVSRFKIGDRVAGTLVQDWLYGSIPETALDSSTTLGHGIDGCLAEYRTFNQDGLVHLPKNLSFVEGATLPCAALTAWNAVKGIRSGETVLILGTGGCALFALQFANALGAKTIITSSSDEKLEAAIKAGANEVINYGNKPEWELEVRKLTDGRGVDHVIETVGPETLDKSIAATRLDGFIHLVGLINPVGSISPLKILFGILNLRGIRVGSRQLFEEMNDFIERKNIHPIISDVYSFENASSAFARQLEGPNFGKIVIRITS